MICWGALIITIFKSSVLTSTIVYKSSKPFWMRASVKFYSYNFFKNSWSYFERSKIIKILLFCCCIYFSNTLLDCKESLGLVKLTSPKSAKDIFYLIGYYDPMQISCFNDTVLFAYILSVVVSTEIYWVLIDVSSRNLLPVFLILYYW